MLEQILRALSAGGSFRVEDLARQLDVSPALLLAMLEDLERMGYLTPMSAGCNGACGSCATGGCCAIIGASKVWALSAPGQRAARRV